MHVAGSIHADVLSRAPGWLGVPADVNDLLPQLWSRNVSKDADGVLTVAGLTRHRDRRAGRHPGLRGRRGRTCAPGPATFADGLRRLGRLLRRQVLPVHRGRPLGQRGGPRRRRVHRRRAGRGAAGRSRSAAGSACTATTRATPSSSRPWTPASAGSSSTPSTRSTGSAGWSPRAGGASGRGSWCGSPPASRRTPTSTSPPRTRTRSSASRSPSGQALDGAAPGARSPGARPGRHPLPHRLADLRCRGLRRGRPADAAAARRVRAPRPGSQLPEMDLGGGFGIAYTSTDTPATPAELAAAMRRIVETECAVLGVAVPHLSIEPGRAISGPSAFALYTVGTVKQVHLDGDAVRHLRGRRRRDERQHPHRAVRRGVLRDPGLAPVRGAARPSPGWSASTARAATSWSGTSSCPPTSPPGDLLAVPASGAYSRSMASNYNHVPRPPVVAVRDGRLQHPAAAGDAGRHPAAGRRADRRVSTACAGWGRMSCRSATSGRGDALDDDAGDK